MNQVLIVLLSMFTTSCFTKVKYMFEYKKYKQ